MQFNISLFFILFCALITATHNSECSHNGRQDLYDEVCREIAAELRAAHGGKSAPKVIEPSPYQIWRTKKQVECFMRLSGQKLEAKSHPHVQQYQRSQYDLFACCQQCLQDRELEEFLLKQDAIKEFYVRLLRANEHLNTHIADRIREHGAPIL